MQNSGYQLKTAQDSILSFYLSHPLRSVLYTLSHARHSGMDCRNLGYRDV